MTPPGEAKPIAAITGFGPLKRTQIDSLSTQPRVTLDSLASGWPWGITLDVGDVLLTLVGFAVTIVGVWKSKTAAQRAEEAAEQTRRAIGHTQTIVDVTAVIASMEELRRLHRAEAWHVLADRYGALRVKLVTIRSTRSPLTPDQQSTLQSAIQHLADFEKSVERAVKRFKRSASNEQAADASPPDKRRLPDLAAYNAIVSNQIDLLTELLLQLQQGFTNA